MKARGVISRAVLAAGLAAALVSGCAQGLDELGSFGCAADGSCPAGFLCGPEKKCVKDLPACKATADCPVVQNTQLGCWETDGRCHQPCQRDLECFVKGSVCASGICLNPCEQDGQCGSNGVCSSGTCLGCAVGVSCSAPSEDPCSPRKISACADPALAGSVPVCGGAPTPAADGSACKAADGNAAFCSKGKCQACAALEGQPCTQAVQNNCHPGVWSCAGGAPVCKPNPLLALPDLSGCGGANLCVGGVCKACSNGDACTPAGNACKTGVVACATPATSSTCTVTGSLGENAYCADNSRCQGGACTACSGDCRPVVLSVGGEPTLVGGVTAFSLAPGATILVQADQAANWAITEAGGGTLSATSTAGSVLYTAPASAADGTKWHVVATSAAVAGRVGTLEITAKGGQSVVVGPRSVARLNKGAQQAFSATSTPAGAVLDWSVAEAGGGSFATATGPQVMYTAPATVGTYHLVVKNDANSAARDVAVVNVVEPIFVNVVPSTSTPATGQQVTLTATVTPAGTDQSVVWSITDSVCGTLSATTGASVTYTAPSIAGRCNVNATSGADSSKSKSTLFTVGNAVEKDVRSDQSFPTGIAIANGSLYWTETVDGIDANGNLVADHGNGRIWTGRLDGSTSAPTIQGEHQPYFMVADGNLLYWVNAGDGTLRKLDLSQGAVQPSTVATVSNWIGNNGRAVGLAAAKGGLFWVDNGVLRGVTPPATTPTSLAAGFADGGGLATDGTNLYATVYGPADNSGKVRRAATTGAASDLLTNLNRPLNISLHSDGTNLYWVNNSNSPTLPNALVQAPLAGGAVTTLAQGISPNTYCDFCSFAAFGQVAFYLSSNTLFVVAGDGKPARPVLSGLPGGWLQYMTATRNAVYWVDWGGAASTHHIRMVSW